MLNKLHLPTLILLAHTYIHSRESIPVQFRSKRGTE